MYCKNELIVNRLQKVKVKTYIVRTAAVKVISLWNSSVYVNSKKYMLLKYMHLRKTTVCRKKSAVGKYFDKILPIKSVENLQQP